LWGWGARLLPGSACSAMMTVWLRHDGSSSIPAGDDLNPHSTMWRRTAKEAASSTETGRDGRKRTGDVGFGPAIPSASGSHNEGGRTARTTLEVETRNLKGAARTFRVPRRHLPLHEDNRRSFTERIIISTRPIPILLHDEHEPFCVSTTRAHQQWSVAKKYRGQRGPSALQGRQLRPDAANGSSVTAGELNLRGAPDGCLSLEETERPAAAWTCGYFNPGGEAKCRDHRQTTGGGGRKLQHGATDRLHLAGLWVVTSGGGLLFWVMATCARSRPLIEWPLPAFDEFENIPPHSKGNGDERAFVPGRPKNRPSRDTIPTKGGRHGPRPGRAAASSRNFQAILEGETFASRRRAARGRRSGHIWPSPPGCPGGVMKSLRPSDGDPHHRPTPTPRSCSKHLPRCPDASHRRTRLSGRRRRGRCWLGYSVRPLARPPDGDGHYRHARGRKDA